MLLFSVVLFLTCTICESKFQQDVAIEVKVNIRRDGFPIKIKCEGNGEFIKRTVDNVNYQLFCVSPCPKTIYRGEEFNQTSYTHSPRVNVTSFSGNSSMTCEFIKNEGTYNFTTFMLSSKSIDKDLQTALKKSSIKNISKVFEKDSKKDETAVKTVFVVLDQKVKEAKNDSEVLELLNASTTVVSESNMSEKKKENFKLEQVENFVLIASAKSEQKAETVENLDKATTKKKLNGNIEVAYAKLKVEDSSKSTPIKYPNDTSDSEYDNFITFDMNLIDNLIEDDESVSLVVTNIPTKEEKITSNIVGVSIGNKKSVKFENQAINISIKTPESRSHCVYLNEAKDWSSDGCSHSWSNNMLTCSCNHLTYFAAMFAKKETIPKEGDDTFQIYLSRIFCTINIVCCIGSMLLCIYSMFFMNSKDRRRIYDSLNFNLLLCLLLAVLSTFLFNDLLIGLIHKSEVTCRLVAISGQFFYLAAGVFMFATGAKLYAETFQIYREFWIEFFLGRFSKLKILLFYAIPFAFVLFTYFLHIVGVNVYFQSENICWLDLSKVYTFLLPMECIASINIVIVVKFYDNIQKMIKQGQMFDKKVQQRLKFGSRKIVGYSIHIGVTWLLGLIHYYFSDKKAIAPFLAAIFTIAVNLQGPYIGYYYAMIIVHSEEYARLTSSKSQTFSGKSTTRSEVSTSEVISVLKPKETVKLRRLDTENIQK